MTEDPFAHIPDAPHTTATTRSNPKGGYRRGTSKTPLQNLYEFAFNGDPEKGGKRAKTKCKTVSHDARARKVMEDMGYTVTRLEKRIATPAGFVFKQDYLGLWDYEGLKPGSPRLLVQVCGDSGKSVHRRKMCSDEKAGDNKRPRIENLRYCIDHGWECVLMSFRKLPNGHYAPTLEKITHETIEKVIARRKKAK